MKNYAKTLVLIVTALPTYCTKLYNLTLFAPQKKCKESLHVGLYSQRDYGDVIFHLMNIHKRVISPGYEIGVIGNPGRLDLSAALKEMT